MKLLINKYLCRLLKILKSKYIKEKTQDKYTLTPNDLEIIKKSCYKDEKSYLKQVAGNK